MIEPYYQEPGITLYKGDCREVMAQLDADSIDTIITDPPYGLEFMGKDWDKAVPGPDFWEAALRVSKPGAMMLAFGGTRLYHRMTCAIEDAGWEIRDCLMWLYGSGFPKSHDISKAIDKANGKHKRDLQPFADYVKESRLKKGWSLRQLDEAMGTNTAASWWEGRKSGIQPPGLDVYNKLKGILDMNGRYDELIEWLEAEREVIGQQKGANAKINNMACPIAAQGLDKTVSHIFDITAPATPEAALWDGWGTALKPAWEPIVLAMKPLDGTFAENALKHGVAGLDIDGGRIGTADTRQAAYKMTSKGLKGGGFGTGKMDYSRDGVAGSACGRWPSNLYLDEDTAPMLDEQSGESVSPKTYKRNAAGFGSNAYGKSIGEEKGTESLNFGDSGGASRFFYIAKPSKADRGHREDVALPLFDTVDKGFRNTHPTVKPTPLMQRLIILQTYLARLTDTPAIHNGGVILDPFGGSGTTAIAAKKAARPCIIIERDKENLDITIERLRQPCPR